MKVSAKVTMVALKKHFLSCASYHDGPIIVSEHYNIQHAVRKHHNDYLVLSRTPEVTTSPRCHVASWQHLVGEPTDWTGPSHPPASTQKDLNRMLDIAQHVMSPHSRPQWYSYSGDTLLHSMSTTIRVKSVCSQTHDQRLSLNKTIILQKNATFNFPSPKISHKTCGTYHPSNPFHCVTLHALCWVE